MTREKVFGRGGAKGIGCFVLVMGLLLAYWGKCSLRVNLISTFSLGRYLSFLSWDRIPVISASETGRLVWQDFESWKGWVEWGPFWAEDIRGIQKQVSIEDEGHSKSLRILNASGGQWAYPHKKYVEVFPGDVLVYQMRVKATGDSLSTKIGFILHDAAGNVVDWNYRNEEVPQSEKWIVRQGRVSVTETGIFLRLRVTGKGVGETWVDDISLTRLKTGEEVER